MVQIAWGHTVQFYKLFGKIPQLSVASVVCVSDSGVGPTMFQLPHF